MEALALLPIIRGPFSHRAPGITRLGSLLGQVSRDLSTLFRQELALAKAETKAEAKKAGQAAGMMAGAGVAAILLLIFASASLMYAIGAAIPLGWAAVIVAVVWAIVAGGLFAVGRKRMAAVNPAPEQTLETVKEDAQWLKTRTS